LDVNGNVIAGDNSYVTDAVASVGVNPNIETGQNFSVRNGCGCKIASRKFPDTFNFMDLTVNLAQLEPTLIAFLTGSALITDGSDTVGWAGAAALACGVRVLGRERCRLRPQRDVPVLALGVPGVHMGAR
jgi:hypothetical protein